MNKEKLKEEIVRLRNLLYMNYFFHHRLYNVAKENKKLLGVNITERGKMHYKEINVVLRKWHNIPKEECPFIVRSLEILGLIKREGQYYKITEPKKSKEQLMWEFKRKLNLNNI